MRLIPLRTVLVEMKELNKLTVTETNLYSKEILQKKPKSSYSFTQKFQIQMPDRHLRTLRITELHSIQQKQKQKSHGILTHTGYDFPCVGGRKQKNHIFAWWNAQT